MQQQQARAAQGFLHYCNPAPFHPLVRNPQQANPPLLQRVGRRRPSSLDRLPKIAETTAIRDNQANTQTTTKTTTKTD